MIDNRFAKWIILHAVTLINASLGFFSMRPIQLLYSRSLTTASASGTARNVVEIALQKSSAAAMARLSHHAYIPYASGWIERLHLTVCQRLRAAFTTDHNDLSLTHHESKKNSLPPNSANLF
jgi:hypothetical protein